MRTSISKDGRTDVADAERTVREVGHGGPDGCGRNDDSPVGHGVPLVLDLRQDRQWKRRKKTPVPTAYSSLRVIESASPAASPRVFAMILMTQKAKATCGTLLPWEGSVSAPAIHPSTCPCACGWFASA